MMSDNSINNDWGSLIQSQDGKEQEFMDEINIINVVKCDISKINTINVVKCDISKINTINVVKCDIITSDKSWDTLQQRKKTDC